ncbi:MAG: LPXTG cell wall anchor domain-containing protein [Gammaproteobacteria bacterium]|nr:LPXTG cell wall anchor domain-containing protein [Gammaproteobacteria bacterium]
MKNATSNQNRTSRLATCTQKSLLPLVAVGGSLAGLPAHALELGEMTVQSRLGQPLRASIAYVLAANEQIGDSCVSLAAGRSTSGLPSVGRATASVADGVILLTGTTPVREPMVSARMVVHCAYTANLSREYMLFIDPAEPIFNKPPVVQSAPAAAPEAPAQVTPAPVARQSTAATTRREPAARKVRQAPIGPSTQYRVQPGDSLSQITERVENRNIGLWAAVDVIFDANPDAFMNNDPNMLKAGSLLTIPSFDGNAPLVSEAADTSDVVLDNVAQNQTASSTVETNIITEAAPAETVEVAPIEIPGVVETTGVVADTTADLTPGDEPLYGDNESPFVDAGDAGNETVVIPDTELEGPTTESSSPNVPTAVINTSTGETTSSWLMWLAGGFVVFIGLLLFGRRSRYSASPITPLGDQAADEVAADHLTGVEAVAPADCDIEDDSPTEENLSLDADLVVGTGLESGSDVDVGQDFGFAQTTALDIELPFEPEAADTSNDTLDSSPIITREQSILDSEILPDDEEYDVSVIMDATKMPQPEDVTQRDLKAIEVDDAATDSYTIEKEMDLDILAQDYEDELTQTQALSAELARAAVEISVDADDETADHLQETGVTIEMPPPIATLTELDLTEHLPARNEDFVDVDETGMYETATLNMSADEFAIDVPEAENDDDTKDMDLDGSTVDTKAI